MRFFCIFFLLLTWGLDTSGNSFMSMTFINHFPLFQLWCMKAFTLVRFQKFLKLTIPISSFKTYYEVFSWENSHLCPVSSFWSSRIADWRAEICLLFFLLFHYNALWLNWPCLLLIYLLMQLTTHQIKNLLSLHAIFANFWTVWSQRTK